MISKSLIVLKFTSVASIINSIMFHNRFRKTYLLKLLYTSVLTGFQNLLFLLELNKIGRNTFINLKTLPTTVYCTIIIAAVFL